MPRRTPRQIAKDKATAIHSKIIRSLGYCENCGKPGSQVQLQCAHWISRRYSHTRTDFDNAFCLCAGCHHYFGDYPTEFSRWAIEKKGAATYDRILEASQRRDKFDWFAELERLREIAKREEVTV